MRSCVIIEDEMDITEAIKSLLESAGFQVACYKTAEDFFSKQELLKQSVYLIDWNLPGIKGIDIVKFIRKDDKLSPILMISGNNKSDQIVEGLTAGADDYITKPFNYNELLVRLINASNKLAGIKESSINIGIKLIPEANTVMRDGASVHLTAREFIIFYHLYNNQDKPSTREELTAKFDDTMNVTARNVDVHVFSLRKKISKINISIETVWGTGYKLSYDS